MSYPVITAGTFRNEGSFKNLLGAQAEESLEEACSLELNVSEYTPKTFIWHTYEDQSVPVQNSLLYVNALVKAGVPVEFHLFPKGEHGLGTATELSLPVTEEAMEARVRPWMDLAKGMDRPQHLEKELKKDRGRALTRSGRLRIIIEQLSAKPGLVLVSTGF